MDQYQNEFKLAVERTLRLGYKTSTFAPRKQRILLDKFKSRKLGRTIQTSLSGSGFLKPYGLATNCTTVSQRIQAPLSEALGIGSFLTVGWVHLNGTKLWEFNEDDFIRWTTGASNNRSREVEVHAWVTLDTLEIVDATFKSTFAMLHGIPDDMGLITSHPYDLPRGCTYHPIVVGNEALDAIENSRVAHLMSQR